MDTTEGLQLGQVVASRAGRDGGRIFAVVKILDGKYVLVADGDLRKVENPKKKSIKHLAVYSHVMEEIGRRLRSGRKLTNEELRNELDRFRGTGEGEYGEAGRD